MSSKRKCIVILLFIVLVTILFILYNRSQFFLGISYRCKYSVYQPVHSKSFKNLSNLTVNDKATMMVSAPHRMRRIKLKSVTTDLPPLPENSLEMQKYLLSYTGLKRPRNFTEYKQCPEGRVLTVLMTGWLGNVIWEYMSLLAVEELYSDVFHMQAYAPANMKFILERLFEELETPELLQLPNSCVSMRNAQLIKRNGAPKYDPLVPYNSPLILEAYSCRSKDVVRYGINKIKKKLRFRNPNVHRINNYLTRIKWRFNFHTTNNVTFVGVHYRGGEYNTMLNKTYPEHFKGPPSFRFYKNAMQHFNSTISNVIFIFVSSDKEWIKSNVPQIRGFNLIVNPLGVEDMIANFLLLEACNHSIINYGSYGAAAALFAEGTTIVYELNIPEDDRGYNLAISLASLLPNWHLCNEIKCLIE